MLTAHNPRTSTFAAWKPDHKPSRQCGSFGASAGPIRSSAGPFSMLAARLGCLSRPFRCPIRPFRYPTSSRPFGVPLPSCLEPNLSHAPRLPVSLHRRPPDDPSSMASPNSGCSSRRSRATLVAFAFGLACIFCDSSRNSWKHLLRPAAASHNRIRRQPRPRDLNSVSGANPAGANPRALIPRAPKLAGLRPRFLVHRSTRTAVRQRSASVLHEEIPDVPRHSRKHDPGATIKSRSRDWS